MANNKKNTVSRRDFLKTSAMAGCGAIVATHFDFARDLIARVEAGELTQAEAYELLKAENTLYSVCLNCNTGCGIKVKILNGVAVKIDGTPYNPFNLHPHLEMKDAPTTAVMVDAGLCPKGQAGHQGAYDPYRVTKVLKRVGKRGENKWQSIPFNQAIDEIINGGKLFANVPGEEGRQVTGLKDLHALTDSTIFEEMGKDVAALRKKKPEERAQAVEEFKVKHAANLGVLIDPNHPDFGPKNNQFVDFWGRKKAGRANFSAAFTGAFGTTNAHGHTTVCQGSLYFACKAMSEQYVGNSFKDGQKFYWQADQENSDYILFVGANLFDGNYGPTNRTIPDLHYLERWEFQGSHPNMPVRVQPVRQPVIASPNEVVTVFGQEQPISYETFWLALAEKLGFKGFGKDGFGEGQDFSRPDDFYIRMVANIALDRKEPVADASKEEIDLFLASRRHLPKNVFDAERWKKIAGPAWPKVVTVLNRGGRFDTQVATYKGDQVANKYGKQINLYQEKTAGCKDAFTGKSYLGLARYVPVADTLGNEPTKLSEGFPLHLITQRDIRHTKARTITHPYLTGLMPENGIILHTSDAKKLGVKSGDQVRVVSATNPEGAWELGNGNKKPMIGKVQVTETIRPGVITFTLGHGHWNSGAVDVTIDGTLVKGDKRRAGGVHANAAMWIDPHLKNTCMIDKVGGSVSFYDTKVKLVKV